jgi:hypothetical protein
MEQPKSKFSTIDPTAAKARNASAEGTSGKLVKKKGAQSGDPYSQAKPSRSNVKAKGTRAYGITASMPSYKDPAAGATQANGRVFTAALNRQAPNFSSGASDALSN